MADRKFESGRIFIKNFGNCKLKLQFRIWIANRNCKLELKLQIGVVNWYFELESQIGIKIFNWNYKFELQLKLKIRSAQLKFGIANSDFRQTSPFRIRIGNWKNFKLKFGIAN